MKINKKLIVSYILPPLFIISATYTTISCDSSRNNHPNEQHIPSNEQLLVNEVNKINNSTIKLKNKEYSSDEILEFNKSNILNNIVGFMPNDKFNYEVIDFKKPQNINIDNSEYVLTFKINVSLKSNKEIKTTNNISLNFWINKAEIEAERINKLNLSGLTLIKDNISINELSQINKNNILSKISNLDLDTSLFDYNVINLNVDQNNNLITFDIQISKKDDDSITFDSPDINVSFNIINQPPLSSNQQILNECIKKIKIHCAFSDEQKLQLKPSQATSFENRKNFSFNEQEINKIGGLTNGFNLRWDIKAPTSVFMEINIWVGKKSDPDYVEKNVVKEIGGFKSEIEVGQLDSESNPNLPTPNGYKSWKGNIGLIDTNPIGSNTFSDKVNKITMNDMQKEFAYQARFILYQSFKDNFSEINYYSKETQNEIVVIAKGIIKNNENRDFFIQSGGSAIRGNGNVKTGDIITIEYKISKNNHTFNKIDSLSWSFADDCNLINNSNSRSQFGIVLPGASLTIKNNENQIYYAPNENKIRTYCFIIGRTKS